jgi:hypothetical protein
VADTRMGAEEAKAAREATARQAEGGKQATRRMNTLTSRIGAVALSLGYIMYLGSFFFHPSREDPMDNRAVFMEYAHSDSWIAVHLAQYFAVLLIIRGLVALYYSITAKPGAGAALARFGLAGAVTTAASYTILQAVDGIALKRAVDAWASAPADQEVAAFAAAEAVRWIEIGINSLSFYLLGLTLFVYGLALALGAIYPRWVGWIGAVAGTALMYNSAVVVAYKGFVTSISGMVGLLCMTIWVFVMAVLMWRNSNRQAIFGTEGSVPPVPPSPQPTSTS